jgi:hypothetical protein
MDDFDRHFRNTGRMMFFAIIAKLAIVGGLIWLAVYAIKAFTA